MAITRFSLTDSLHTLLNEGVTLLTPSFRLAESVIEAYGSKTSASSWREPHVVAVDVWVADCWESLANRGVKPCVELEILSSGLERELWLEAIELTRDAHPLVDAKAMAQIAARAFQDLRRWSEDPAVHSLSSAHQSEDSTVYLQWQAHFQQRCTELNRVTLVEATKLLAETVSADTAALFGPIALLDFYQTPPNYQALFDALAHTTSLTRVTSHDPDVFAQDLSTLLLRNNVKAARYEFMDPRNEVEAAVHWALDKQQTDPSAHIGIITPAPAQVRPAIERALLAAHDPDAALRVLSKPHLLNSSANAYSLADSAFAHAALLFLGFNQEQQSASDFSTLLRTPFLPATETEMESRIRCEVRSRRELQAETTRSAIARLTGAEGKPYACPALHSALLESRTLLRACPSRQLPAAWTTLFRAQLDIAGWPGQTAGALTLAAHEAWESVLTEFEESGEYSGAISLDTALAALRRRVATHRGTNVYRQQCSLSLYSPPEASGLSFSHVWLLGFDDQSWPAAAHPNPLIPPALQKELAIPGCSAASQFSAAKHELASLCSSVSGSLTASHTAHKEESECRPSRLISDVPLHQIPDRVFKQPAREFLGETQLERVADVRRIPLNSDAIIPGGQAIITEQSQCPFQAFVKRRIGAAELEPPRNGLDARDRGTAVHSALEKFYQDIGSQHDLHALIAAEPEALKQAIEKAATHAVTRLKRAQPELMGTYFTQIEHSRVSILLNQFVMRDAERGAFSASCPEEPLALSLNGLTLNLSVDRIDTLDDGSNAVIDYKTGKSITAITALASLRPQEMQLPVYYTAAQQTGELTVSAVAIAQVHIEKAEYHAIVRSGNFDRSIEPLTGKKLNQAKLEPPDSTGNEEAWQLLTSNWVALVDSLASEFVAGECRVDPVDSKTVCERCKLQSLCRIDELRGAPADSDDEEMS